MDNYRFDMTCEGDSKLRAAIELAAREHRIVGYVIREAHDAFVDEKYRHLDKPKRPPRIIFMWSDYQKVDGFVAFPFPMDAAGAADFAGRWLKTVDYGREPDHDGDNEKGWRVYNEAWGHIEEIRSAVIAVSPAWAMYGK